MELALAYIGHDSATFDSLLNSLHAVHRLVDIQCPSTGTSILKNANKKQACVERGP